MRIRTWSDGILLFSGCLLTFAPLLRAEAQDVDVQGNVTMHDSTDSTVGNVLKEGVPFLHNFGFRNTFLGSNAGNVTMAGFSNTGAGAAALTANSTGYENTAIGDSALASNSTGDWNTAVGAQALLYNTTGNGNTAVGEIALQYNSTGSNNTAIGSATLPNNRGSSNTAIGAFALDTNSTGSSNTANGTAALSTNADGDYNTATGYNALARNSTGGNRNTATGAAALLSNTTGERNTALGYLADVSTGDLTNATAIGAGAIVDASDKIRFGNADVTVIEGQVPYTYTSDRNKKENFQPMDPDDVLTKLRRLTVTSWNYKGQDAKQFRHYGPMAQDFFAAFGRDAVGTIGTPTTITSGDLDGILMIAVQALEKRTVEQEKQIGDLKAELKEIKRRVGGEVAANVSAGL